MLDEILFQNEEKIIYLLDIPTSIAAAQRDNNNGRSDALVSCTPLTVPFASTEPKSQKAADRVKNHMGDDAVHEAHVAFIKEALVTLLAEYNTNSGFCHKRVVVHALIDRQEKRKRRHSERAAEAQGQEVLAARKTADYGESDTPNSHDSDFDFGTKVSYILSQLMCRERSTSLTIGVGALNDTLPANEVESGSIQSNNGYFTYHNDYSQHVQLRVSTTSTLLFEVPRNSAFILGKCENVHAFRYAARAFLSSAAKARFDMILLDPPWPNNSARRHSSYETTYDMAAMKKMLLRMDLDMQVRPGGYVAVWITNRPAVRECVLGPGGLFEAWNVARVEEWICLKVTTSGEPVYPLDGQWKKPYEVLLIGQRPEDPLASANEPSKFTRRLLITVPDLHSRKPCLRELLKLTLFASLPDYTCLEIFARYLVEGWFSWGDEVLKYNADGFWVPFGDAKHDKPVTSRTEWTE